MKRILLTLAFALITGAASQALAQSGSASQQYESFVSVRAGINFGDLQNSDFYSQTQTGFNAAVLYNIPLMADAPLYLQSGLGIEMKGARNTGLLAGVLNSHLKSYMLEVPLVVTYDIPIGQQTAIVPMLGAYYSFAFAGTLKGNGETFHQFKKQEIELINGETVDSRFMRQSDIGLRAGLAFRYNKCLIGVAYDSGMMNVFSKAIRDLGSKAYTGTFSINLEYRFN